MNERLGLLHHAFMDVGKKSGFSGCGQGSVNLILMKIIGLNSAGRGAACIALLRQMVWCCN